MSEDDDETTGNERGGARPGAGRPPNGTIGVMLRLRRETARDLARTVKHLPKGDRWGAKSRIAEAAIRRHLKLPDLPPV